MIGIDVVLDGNGILCSCTVTGHANAGKTGTDIVCAAVSVLTRTLARVLSNRKGIIIRSSAPEPGRLRLEIEYTAEGRNFLSAAGEFLVTGLASVADEFPGNCTLNITERRT